jgi:hypothetical protein
VATPAHCPPGAAEDGEDEADDDEYPADGLQDRNARDETNHEKDYSKKNHDDSKRLWTTHGPVLGVGILEAQRITPLGGWRNSAPRGCVVFARCVVACCHDRAEAAHRLG